MLAIKLLNNRKSVYDGRAKFRAAVYRIRRKFPESDSTPNTLLKA